MAVCTSCGATTLNPKHCEFCQKPILQTGKSREHPHALNPTQEVQEFVFPNINEALRLNLEKQKNSDFVCTDIGLVGMTGGLLQVIDSQAASNYLQRNTSNPGLAISLTFPEDTDREALFLAMPEAQFFAKHFFDGIPSYLIDCGQDTQKTVVLVSRILRRVYSISPATPLSVHTWRTGPEYEMVPEKKVDASTSDASRSLKWFGALVILGIGFTLLWKLTN